MSNKSITIDSFHAATRFAIDPKRIGVVESGYPGCIEVHLTRYSYDTRQTLPGGNGLVLSGAVKSIYDGAPLYDRFALISGFPEVFEVACHYDAVVVLRPLGIGVGRDWERSQRYGQVTKRKRRLQNKYKNLSRKYLTRAHRYMQNLSGNLAGQSRRDSGPYFLRERTKRWSSESAINAHTLEQARQTAALRVEQLKVQGWTCGEEACVRGTIQRATASTVAWLCQKNGQSKWVSVECGTPKPKDAPSRFGAPDTYTVEEIFDMCKTWVCFNGFSGEHCSNCLADANVLGCGPGWFCACGMHNCQSWSNCNIPHEHPDYGPGRAVIYEGVASYRRSIGELPDGISTALPGGFFDRLGGDPGDAASRELAEETGIKTTSGTPERLAVSDTTDLRLAFADYPGWSDGYRLDLGISADGSPASV